MFPRSLRGFRFPTRLIVAAAALVLAIAVSRAATTQGGAGEWAMKAPLASRSLLLDVSARDGLLVAVGERGHVLVSRDAGGSWTQARVASRTLLTGVYMHDTKLGWAVGHDEVVLRTRDGGLTWERVHYAPEEEKPLLDVWFADAERGLAVGAYGGVLATADGGTTWERRAVNGSDDFHLNHIVRASDGTLYIAAEAGHLYRSADGGNTWEKLTSPYQGSFFGVLPLSNGSLLAFGLRGRLFRSADQGRTWQQVETGTEATLTCALELGPDRFVAAGLAGTLLWSDGAGAPLRKQELENRRGILALARTGKGQLLLFGEGGVQRLEVGQ